MSNTVVHSGRSHRLTISSHTPSFTSLKPHSLQEPLNSPQASQTQKHNLNKVNCLNKINICHIVPRPSNRKNFANKSVVKLKDPKNNYTAPQTQSHSPKMQSNSFYRHY